MYILIGKSIQFSITDFRALSYVTMNEFYFVYKNTKIY